MTGLDELRVRLDGDLLTPDSPGYGAARLPAQPRTGTFIHGRSSSAHPRETSPAQLPTRTTGTRVVPRSGGHCFAGRSSTDGLLLSLGRLDAVAVDGDGRARIGAGARLAHVYDATLPDPRLESWADAYHGGNLPHLVAAKHTYDPDRLLSFPQAI